MTRKEPKTLRLACWPDGSRTIITFRQGAYWWTRSEGSYPLSAAIEAVEERGGWIERVPNPNWRPKSPFDL